MRDARSRDYLSRRQLTAGLGSSLASILLSNAALSLPKSPDFIPHKIYSPGNTYIGQVLLKSGDDVTSQQPVLLLDRLDLESELAKRRCELDLARISAERLEDDYVKRFVLCTSGVPADDPPGSTACPLNKIEDFRFKVFDAANKFDDWEKSYLEVGNILPMQYDLYHADTLKAAAALVKAREELAKVSSQVAEQRTSGDAKISALQKQITIIEEQIALCNIVAPGYGRLVVHVFPEMFVEKGDLLFEVV